MRELVLVIRRRLERNDALLKHGIIMLLASAMGTFFNYLYQLFMGRILRPEEYGILGVLISLVYVLTVPVQTIQVSTIKVFSRFRVNEKDETLGFLLRHIGKKVSLLSFLGMIGILAASNFIAKFLRIRGIIPVVFLGVIFFFQLLLPTFHGALQGLQRFTHLGANQIANFGSKLLFGVMLVSLGLGVEGALAGIIIGNLMGILLSIFFLRDIFRQTPVITKMPQISSYSVYTFVTFLFITLFYNIDIILVKRLFTSVEAGYYVAASTLAKAVFFASTPIVGAMFPKVSAWNDRNNEAVTTRLLKDALFYTGFLAGLGTLILNLFPGFVVSFLYGFAYKESTNLVGLFAIGMLLFSLSYVLILYQLALARKKFLPLLALGAVMEVGGIMFFHSSLWNVVAVFTAVMALIFLSMLALTPRYKLKY